MQCRVCGRRTKEEARFCSGCGAPLGEDDSTPLSDSRARGYHPASHNILQDLSRYQLVIGLLLVVLLFAAYQMIRPADQSPQPTQPTSSMQRGGQPADASQAVAIQKPKVPPPKFRIYSAELNGIISVVVPPASTDEELKSLLWLFREKVRSHRFKDIGITKPTSKNFGKTSYQDGLISVYRGDRCAGENSLSVTLATSPCGYGDHSVAEYQWGIMEDGIFHPSWDSGGLVGQDGSGTVVFDHKDGWEPPTPALGTPSSTENGAPRKQ